MLLLLAGAIAGQPPVPPPTPGGHPGRPARNVARRPVPAGPDATIDEDDESVLVVLLLGVAEDQEGPW